MKLSDLPLALKAMRVYADDLGENLNPEALIPVEWHPRASRSEIELAKFDHFDLETFMLSDGETCDTLLLTDRAERSRIPSIPDLRSRRRNYAV
jgi:hypothetical protein